MTKPTRPSAFTPRASAYLEAHEERLSRFRPAEIARHIETIVDNHDKWRWQCLNMNPAESAMSMRARAILASDTATRLSEGLPGDKAYPHGAQNNHIDEIEATIIALARRQFGAAFVEWRPVSTSMANAGVFFSFLSPGDAVIAQSEDGGGNFSYHAKGPAGLAGARIFDAPHRGDAFEIDVERIAKLAEEVRPRMIVIGGSNILFPYPVAALRRIADTHGALLVYDAAHLGLLVSAGDFQRPLDEGAHIMTVSTHKIMGGPVGGLALTNDEALASKLISTTFPGFMQTRDQNKFAALAITLAELEIHGPALAQAMVDNACALAAALENEGFELLAADRHFTRCHQIFLKLGEEAQRFEQRCQAANILVSDCALTGDMPAGRRWGSRLSTHELTRRGLGTEDMRRVAGLIGRAVRGDAPEAVAREVAGLLAQYPAMHYTLDDV